MPQQQRQLLETLGRYWAQQHETHMTADVLEMRRIAPTESEVRKDDAIRSLTEQETKVLLAYLGGQLELPRTPNFLKATMPLLRRAMLEQFHETHMEVTLMDAVPPRADLRRDMTHLAICAQLYEANSDFQRGRQLIDRLMDDIKLMQFDGIQALKCVFNSRRLAERYSEITLYLRGDCITLDDTECSKQLLADGFFSPVHI